MFHLDATHMLSSLPVHILIPSWEVCASLSLSHVSLAAPLTRGSPPIARPGQMLVFGSLSRHLLNAHVVAIGALSG